MDRREFVLTAVSAGVLGTAGCAGSDDASPDGATTTARGDGTATPAETSRETTRADTTPTESETTTPADGTDDDVTETPVGEPPEARIDATPTRGPAPLTVAFDGRGSVDPDGEIVEYIWLFKDMRPPVTGPTAEHTFTSDGTTRAVELIVTDDDGNTDRATVEIRIDPASA